MSSSDMRTAGRRTITLGINRIPDNATLITVAKACEKFISGVKGIRLIKFKSDNTRNALIDFISPNDCENAKNMGDITLGSSSYSLHYARSKDTPNYDITASEDKLYVKYPEGANENDIVKMLGNVSVNKPENAKNFFFATCGSIDEQVKLIKAFDKKPVAGGNLSVKVAIDKTRKPKRNSIRSGTN
ncbi:hypothetical protein PAEPH01_2690 [Pancytospora epiphaga]|nr:hypothetical protein PAEPH01_2690 [Pancytospora epiphaga]